MSAGHRKPAGGTQAVSHKKADKEKKNNGIHFLNAKAALILRALLFP